jgi:hypothetical protein
VSWFGHEGLGFYAIVFSDLVGSTDLRVRLGDSAADELHHRVDDATHRVVDDHGGAVVKGLGDGNLAVFRAPSDAVAAAAALQHELARLNRRGPTALELRIGVAAGEVDLVDGDVFGFAVNEAARLCSAAPPGAILVSELVTTLAQRGRFGWGDARQVTISPTSPPSLARPLVVPDADHALVPIPSPLAEAAGAPFVGRSRQLAELVDQWGTTRAGAPGVTFLVGAPGIGKTRLMARFAEVVSADGGLVLYGCCTEQAAAPYQPFVDALAAFVAGCPVHELPALLGPDGPELARLVPEVRDRLAQDPGPRLPDPLSDRWHLFEAVAGWLDATAQIEPVVLVLDDLHWAHSATLDLVAHLLRGAPDRRLMLVLAFRPWDPSSEPQLGQLLADRHRLPHGVLHVDLGGLEPAEVGELVARTTGRDDIGPTEASELCTATGGNPLFVAQVIRAAGDGEIVPSQVPAAVVELIDRQLDRLGGPARELLAVAATMGQTFELSVAADAAGLERRDGLLGFDEATQAGFVHVATSTPLVGGFAHALVRDAIEQRLSPGRRVDCHARVALALMDTAQGGTELNRRLAYHLSEAGEFGDPARGIEACCAAASEAIDSLDIVDAIELLDRADRLAAFVSDAEASCEVAVVRAEALNRGALEGARRAQLVAAATAEKDGSAAQQARAALANSRGYFSAMGRLDVERIAVLESALARLDATEAADRRFRVALLSTLADELTFGDPDRQRFAMVDEALDLARQLDDPSALASVLNHRQYVLGGPQHLDVRLAESQQMLDIAVASGDLFLEARALRLRCAAAAEKVDYAEVDRCLRRHEQINDHVDLVALQWELTSIRTSRALVSGDLEAVDRLVRDGFRLGEQAEQRDAYLFTGLQMAQLQLLRGRLADVVDAIVASSTLTADVGIWPARNLLLVGRDDEAREWWDRARRYPLDELLDIGVIAGTRLNAFALVASRLEDREAIVEARRHLEPYANHMFNQLAPDQPGHHYLALLASAAGDHDEADARFEASIEMLERIPAPLMAATSQVEWSRALAARGEHERAAALAHEAATIAGPRGAKGVIDQVESVLALVDAG